MEAFGRLLDERRDIYTTWCLLNSPLSCLLVLVFRKMLGSSSFEPVDFRLSPPSPGRKNVGPKVKQNLHTLDSDTHNIILSPLHFFIV